MGKNISKELAKLEDAWEGAEPEQGGIAVKDDDYVASIDSMEIAFSKKKNLMCVTDYKIADGTYEGKIVKKFDMLQSEQNLSYFKGYCEVLGIEYPDSIADLPDAITEFMDNFDSLVNITLKTKDDAQRLYIKGVSEHSVGEESGDEGSGEPEEAPEDGADEGDSYPDCYGTYDDDDKECSGCDDMDDCEEATKPKKKAKKPPKKEKPKSKGGKGKKKKKK